MKLGFITKEDPTDRLAYSGTNYAMLQALKNEFEEVIPIGPVDDWYKNIAKLKGRIKTLGTDKVFKYQYDLNLAKKHAKIIDQRIQKGQPDVLFGSLVSPEIAFLETKIPLYLTTDATFPLLQDLYKSHSNLYSESIKNALILERTAFGKAVKLFPPLEWISNSAYNHYRIPKNKIKVIPYGSNLDSPEENEVNEHIQNRIKSEEVILLFVGVRWDEKGGPEAVRITSEMNKNGIKAKLIVVGCNPTINEEFVDVVGFLDKQNPQQLAQLIGLYQTSSFFILPTKAECVGMSFIEAASFGLPAIGTNVGGVPEAVIHEKTGLIFDVDENPLVISQEIRKIWRDMDLYSQLCTQSYSYYLENMNWKNWAKRIREEVS